MSPDFIAKVTDALARRAALRCSNPDCDKLTVGPNDQDTKTTSIGEAAHIYGARESAARYRADMIDEARASISNAIWLCRDCHGLIDKDPNRYPADLLLLWKQSHEEKIQTELGKPGELLRLQIQARALRPFAKLPLYAQQIIRDKATGWEYALTAELLEHYLNPVFRRASDLERGLVTRSRVLLDPELFSRWAASKASELGQCAQTLERLMAELKTSWGPSGQPGDEGEIDHVCGLFARTADHLVLVAEEALFYSLPEGFERCGPLIAESAFHVLKHLPQLSTFLRSAVSDGGASRRLVVEINMPEGWEARFDEEIARGVAALRARDNRW